MNVAKLLTTTLDKKESSPQFKKPGQLVEKGNIPLQKDSIDSHLLKDVYEVTRQ